MRKVNLSPDDYYTQGNNGTIQDSESGITVFAKDACMPTARIMYWLGNGFKIEPMPIEPLDNFLTRKLITKEAVAFCRNKYPWSCGIPPNEVHGMYNSYLEPLVLGERKSDFVQNLTYDSILNRMDQGQVIMTSGRVHGVTQPLEGHAFCIIGYDGEDLLIADPYGDFRTNYKSKKGYSVPMTRTQFNSIVKPLGPHHSPTTEKWGHIPI